MYAPNLPSGDAKNKLQENVGLFPIRNKWCTLGRFVNQCMKCEKPYLGLCSKYQHMSAQKQVTYLVCNIGTQCKHAKCQDVYLVHVADNLDMIIFNNSVGVIPFG